MHITVLHIWKARFLHRVLAHGIHLTRPVGQRWNTVFLEMRASCIPRRDNLVGMQENPKSFKVWEIRPFCYPQKNVFMHLPLPVECELLVGRSHVSIMPLSSLHFGQWPGPTLVDRCLSPEPVSCPPHHCMSPLMSGTWLMQPYVLSSRTPSGTESALNECLLNKYKNALAYG